MDKRHPSSFQQLEKLGEGTYATVSDVVVVAVAAVGVVVVVAASAHRPCARD